MGGSSGSLEPPQGEEGESGGADRVGLGSCGFVGSGCEAREKYVSGSRGCCDGCRAFASFRIISARSFCLDRIPSSSISVLKEVFPAEHRPRREEDPRASRKAGKLGRTVPGGSAPDRDHQLQPSAARSSSAASVHAKTGLPAASHRRLADRPSAAFPAFLQSREQ
jgi:hypothetical protein